MSVFLRSWHLRNCPHLHSALSDVESLIKAVHHAQKAQTEIKKAVGSRTKDSEMLRSEDWCQLRHYLGRLHSYRQAASFIVCAAKKWPLLFEDVKITSLPSSSRMFKPILNSGLTAATIIENIPPAEKDKIPELKRQAEDLCRMGVDEAIQEQVCKRTFRPIVHAEVLIHDYLVKNKITEPDGFWKGWQYIGTSKPTCRMCQYYFNSHPQNQIRVRSSHGNLYPNWRVPEISENDDAEAQKAHKVLVTKISERIWNDVQRTLRQRTTQGKLHDSNTYSTSPRYLVLRSGSKSSDDGGQDISDSATLDGITGLDDSEGEKAAVA